MRRRSWGGRALRLGAVLLPLSLAACQTLLRPHRGDGRDPDCPPGPDCHVHLKSCNHPTVMALAHDLDHLERHIDWYGSAVAKVPDIWGQARLTQYREDFEQQMVLDLSKFEVKLAGSTSRTDQSYLAYSMAISAAAGGAPSPAPLATSAIQNTSATAQQGAGGGAGGSGVAKKEDPKKEVPKTPPELPQPVTFVKSDTSTRVVEKFLGAGAINLEPATQLAQKKRYLDFLAQLRRENEGSDTADGPGYSLNLVRIPVSVLPGKRTDVGHGAEITMTINPVFGDDLLPMTFRNMVVNDLVGQIGFPLTQFLDEDRLADPSTRYLLPEVQDELQWLETGIPRPKSATATGGRATSALDEAVKRSYGGSRGAESRAAVTAALTRQLVRPRLSFANGLDTKQAFPSSQLLDVYGYRYGFEIAYAAKQALHEQIDRNQYVALPDVQAYLREELRAARQFLAQPHNQHLWQFCDPHLAAMVRSQQWDELGKRREQYEKAVKDLTGSEAVALRPKLDAAGQPVLDANKRPELEPTPVAMTRQFSVTSALAWAILVDSALLTDRLIRDMRETATSKGVGLAGCREWLPYYLPEPPPEARGAFNEYVKVRWPIRVFALDPYTEQQNIADSLSTRRELQLALSVAFTQGAISTNQLLQYARRLEAEYETIALNNTQVGFGHGENVFGWRFYPRFQTPDTPSNLTVLVRDTLIGGPNKNALLRGRRLEPGARECVAVVMMPSFVPYVTVDTTANWFGLANPKHKVLDHTQAMGLSRTVQAIKTCGPAAASDAACYRDGDFCRLLRRAEQLEARLPAQTLTTPVPILNTLGGFAMFSNGTTDLAPELYGWYGAPGVWADKETTLFLVGDHFSPLRTRVIVGNQRIPVPADHVKVDANPDDAEPPAPPATVHQRLLSRQVMQVTIPAAAAATPLVPVPGGRKAGEYDQYVTVHVATPYGVTREVLIPVIKSTLADTLPKGRAKPDAPEVAPAPRPAPPAEPPATPLPPVVPLLPDPPVVLPIER